MNSRREISGSPFCTIAEAVRRTGLSRYYLTRGVAEGTIPHIKSGRITMIYMPAMMEGLKREMGLTGETT